MLRHLIHAGLAGCGWCQRKCCVATGWDAGTVFQGLSVSLALLLPKNGIAISGSRDDPGYTVTRLDCTVAGYKSMDTQDNEFCGGQDHENKPQRFRENALVGEEMTVYGYSVQRY